MAPIDRSLRADRPLQTMPPTASSRRRTKADPSAPPESSQRVSDSHSSLQDAIFRSALTQLGRLLLPFRWRLAGLDGFILVAAVALFRHRHDRGINDLPAT